MGRFAISFGLFVTLVIILGTENKANADPEPKPELIPTRYEICRYLRGFRHRDGRPFTAATLSPQDKTKADRKEKIQLFGNLLQELLSLEKETEKKSEEEKKKEEDRKRIQEQINQQPKGFASMNALWDNYVQFLTTLFYSF